MSETIAAEIDTESHLSRRLSSWRATPPSKSRSIMTCQARWIVWISGSVDRAPPPAVQASGFASSSREIRLGQLHAEQIGPARIGRGQSVVRRQPNGLSQKVQRLVIRFERQIEETPIGAQDAIVAARPSGRWHAPGAFPPTGFGLYRTDDVSMISSRRSKRSARRRSKRSAQSGRWSPLQSAPERMRSPEWRTLPSST